MKLIDIDSTVDAIGIIDARDYFNLSDTRPKWAYVGDVVMKEAMRAEDKARLPSEFHDALLNPVMHKWKPNATKLPNTLKNIERIRKKYDIQICAPQPTKEVRRQMPMWDHPYPRKHKNDTIHTKAHRCLLRVHNVKLTGDAEDVAVRLKSKQHKPRRDCKCPKCIADRGMGCENPHICAVKAQKLLDNIHPKWDPRRDLVGPDLDTVAETEVPSRSTNDDRGTPFNGSFRTNSIGESIRVFAKAEETGQDSTAKPRQKRRRAGRYEESHLTIYTDGSCPDTASHNRIAGGGMWIGPEDPRNKNVRIEGTNQTGEVAGALLAAQTAHEQTSLQIVSDSEFVIEGLTKRLSKFEDNGWIGVSDGEYMKALVAPFAVR
ncbi:hypothetical protein GGG16DRAFT_67288 [Schizophyllum commune]